MDKEKRKLKRLQQEVDFLLGDATPPQPALSAYRFLGGNIKAMPLWGGLSNITGGLTMVDNSTRFLAIYLPTATTITGVGWVQGVAGDYTADNYNGIGLYTYSGGTLTLVASTTNDGNIWKATANTYSTKAFSTIYQADAGLYYIGILWNASATVTAPTIGGGAGLGSITAAATASFTNSAKLIAILAGTNTLPTPQAMSGLTTSATNLFAALY